MADEFNPSWSRLLVAQSVDPEDGQLRIEGQFHFRILQAAIEHFKNTALGGTQVLLDTASQRSTELRYRLSYADIAGAWSSPVEEPQTWHSNLPGGLRRLVAADPEQLADGDWDKLRALLETLTKAIDDLAKNKNSPEPWGQWRELLVADVDTATLVGEGGGVQAWAALEFSEAKDGLWLLPVCVSESKQLEVKLELPEPLALKQKKSAQLSVPDPRTLVPLARPMPIELSKTSKADDVTLSIPSLYTDELSWASRVLRSYRISPEIDGNEASLWDAALHLDPPASETGGNLDVSTWQRKAATFKERLLLLVSVGVNGLDRQALEILISAAWARRLAQMTAHGLSYVEGDDPKSIKPIEGVLQPLEYSAEPPPPRDADSSPEKARAIEELDPLLCAFYVSLRTGSGASTASARSLDITAATIGSEVVGLLTRPEQVYKQVALNIKHKLIDASEKPVRNAIDLLTTPRVINFKPGRPLIALDVLRWVDGVRRSPSIEHVAALNVTTSTDVQKLTAEGTLISALLALKRVYQSPRAGGLPSFIADLVDNGLDASGVPQASAQEVTSTENIDTKAPVEIPDGLRRLFTKGFEGAPGLLAHLVERAGSLKLEMRGARDIVRLGRSRFIERFQAKGKFDADLLSRVYSRAWSKTNARAQFIAATRGATQSDESLGEDEADGTPAPFPDLAELFGLTDLPSCTWGESIHGPAAYLADILEFLRHRRLISVGGESSKERSALDLLLDVKRRPDLAEIDLSDKNANVEMPFIDLVNELLERLVVGSDAFKLKLEWRDWQLKKGEPISGDMREKLNEAVRPWGLSLVGDVFASPIPQTHVEHGCRHERWVLRDSAGVAVEFKRHLDEEGRPEAWRARLVPQTTLTADEMASEPQFVERQAYTILAESSGSQGYAMPWSLGESQIREWLDLVGVTPSELLAGAWAPAAALPTIEEQITASPRDIARWVDHLGLSQAEGSGLVFHPDSADTLLASQGEQSIVLAAFMQRSAISFDEVMALEQSHSVGGALGLHLVRVEGDLCSADSTKITVKWTHKDGPSTTAKFLRLKRRLGWSIGELDLALSSLHVGNGTLNARCAQRLSQLVELRDRLGLSLTEALRIFTRLRTTALGKATSGEWAQVFLDPRSNGADTWSDAKALKLLGALAAKTGKALTIGSLLQGHDNSEREELGVKLATLIAASLRLDVAELSVLIEVRHGSGATLLSMNREELSQVFGASILLHALKIPIVDFKALVALLGKSPFEDPGEALRLVSLKQSLDSISLSPQSLTFSLVPPNVLEDPSSDQANGCSPKVVMDAVLSLHRALSDIDVEEPAVLLQLGSARFEPPPPTWARHLSANGVSLSAEMTWAERVGVLTRSVRRQLPRIKQDIDGLRRKQTAGFSLPVQGGCEGSSPMLAEQLERLSAWLEDAQALPEPPSPKAARVSPADDQGDALKNSSADGGGFLSLRMAHWVVEGFVPVLQWSGLSLDDVTARLRPWLSIVQQGLLNRRSPPEASVLPASPEDAALLVSYLLCQPLEHHALRAERKAAVSAALAQALATSEPLAWALLSSTPADVDVDESAADWWMKRDVGAVLDGAETPWKGPSERSLTRLAQDLDLRAAYRQIEAALLYWKAVGGLGLDEVTFSWLTQRQCGRGAPAPIKLLKVLEPADLLAHTSIERDGHRLPQLVERWQGLVAWAKVFLEVPDIKAGGGATKPLSLRGDVLDKLLYVVDGQDLAEGEYQGVLQTIERLMGLTPNGATQQLAVEAKPSPLLKPETYSWLRSVDVLLARSGLTVALVRSVDDAFSGRHEGKLIELSSAVRASLKKRFTEASWKAALRKGQDRIRAQKRDALVQYLLSQSDGPWNIGSKGVKKGEEPSPDRLYEHLLLDTQMASCMTTSRIVQAHASVQQFALRCMMGLELGWEVPVNELADWGQWKWMRTYRVWEACRKIFLYPENWMEPELRDDKSSFFGELESDLNQGELTNENAELAFIRYLHKLHEVARLDVVATYYEFNANEPVMHVLGRTRSQPFRYFYRQWVDERRWTPWESVDLEIESPHIVLFKRGGRIHLGWLTAVHEERKPTIPKQFKAVQSNQEYTVSGVEEPKVRWKLQLNTSQKAAEGWQAKRTSPGYLAWPPEAVAMSELVAKHQVSRLQLSFQDFGIPEVLVTSLPPNSGSPSQGNSSAKRSLVGTFSLTSCLGVAQPEEVLSDTTFMSYPVVDGGGADAVHADGARWLESASISATHHELTLLEGAGGGDAVLQAVPSILAQPKPGIDPTPGRFSVTLASQVSLLDACVAVARAAMVPPPRNEGVFSNGLGLPFFYSDDAVDIVVRIRFASGLSAREIARQLGELRDVVLSDGVQSAIWTEPDGESSGQKRDWAKLVLRSIKEAAPNVSPQSLLSLLTDVAAGYPSTGPFELAARNHHPIACDLINRAEGRGVANVFSGRMQDLRREEVYRGRMRSGLSDVAISRFTPYAIAYDEAHDAYAGYNWEVFYHAPYMIAMKFASEGKFEDALQWFHYIFDPAGIEEAGAKTRQFWRIGPFRAGRRGSKGKAIDVLLNPGKWGKEVESAALLDLAEAIMAWRRKPNLPFQVARGRWDAFQKAVVYRYIDTLIAWADARFRLDTREEITAASQLYVLAARLLGRRPRTDISMCKGGTGLGCGLLSYVQLQEIIDRRDDELSMKLDAMFGAVDNVLDCSENEAPDSPHLNFYNEYFCIPPNEKLFDLWDKVADRLYKVRNCLNIDGEYRSLALFAPPIDPALLARAGAAGLSFDQIMAGLNQPRSHYRFSVLLQKANEVAAELRTLGAELLQALEKRDAEELSLLKSRLDLQAARLNKDIRDEQINEASAQLEAIAGQIRNVEERQSWYQARITRGVSGKESESLDGIRNALLIRTAASVLNLVAGGAAVVPKVTIGGNGAFGSPHFALEVSGEPVAASSSYFAEMLGMVGDVTQTGAGITSTLAAYERRQEEWQLQRDMAAGELATLEKQRLASEIRLTIAKTEKRNLERSIESAEATDTFLKTKFTNSGLYDWMARQVSAVYYKTYQLASDYARTAEDCLNRELPVSLSGVKVVRSEHWNGLRKGLLAATSLIHDLKRLESEYIKRNKRVPELAKQVSLAVVDPYQLMRLRATGRCQFKVPEVLFEMDHPGQVARRIKSVSMSVPCVAGPFTGVSGRLSLLSSAIRRQGSKDLEMVALPAEVIYTSSGSRDSGMWEPSLRDERYLPFEGAGAAESVWRLEFPSEIRQFDYASISDVVLHIQYTAEPDSRQLDFEKDLANKLRSAKGTDSPLWFYTSLRSDLGDQFAALSRGRGLPDGRLLLSRTLMHWLGQTVDPTGEVKIIVYGAGTAPAIQFAGGRPQAVGLLNSTGCWEASVTLQRPDELFDPNGVELKIDGLTELRDVVMCFAGKVSAKR